MALVNVTNVIVLDNPTVFTNPFQFEVNVPLPTPLTPTAVSRPKIRTKQRWLPRRRVGRRRHLP